MKIVNFAISLLSCAFLFGGCTNTKTRITNHETFVADALEHSKLFAHVRSVSKKAFFMIEEDHSEYFEVAVGSSTPERFERLGTLRISKTDRTVLKQDYDTAGEEVWVNDTIKNQTAVKR